MNETTKKDRAKTIARLTWILPELDDEGLEALRAGAEVLLQTHRRALDEGTLAAEQQAREVGGACCYCKANERGGDGEFVHRDYCPVRPAGQNKPRPVPGEIVDVEHSGERGPRVVDCAKCFYAIPHTHQVRS